MTRVYEINKSEVKMKKKNQAKRMSNHAQLFSRDPKYGFRQKYQRRESHDNGAGNLRMNLKTNSDWYLCDGMPILFAKQKMKNSGSLLNKNPYSYTVVHPSVYLSIRGLAQKLLVLEGCNLVLVIGVVHPVNGRDGSRSEYENRYRGCLNKETVKKNELEADPSL
ncbi:hypothetical protein EVAR_28672_1 [Eumeta japonica]|uniref:Uncharacterized protein n=1 Tax=Eumeta variegata TaxID=151549 RepID=A0A4C1V5H7_EUMVA|nr:hypothetical protein EVAR_28672_1 [Eumeta japonica]